MKVGDTRDKLMKCICGTCPTYSSCMKEGMQGLFCARGKSSCALAKRGCVCGKCPLWAPHSLAGGYFCEGGAAS